MSFVHPFIDTIKYRFGFVALSGFIIVFALVSEKRSCFIRMSSVIFWNPADLDESAPR